MYCDLWLQYIKKRKLFKGGNYSRAETIHANTVTVHENKNFQKNLLENKEMYFKNRVIDMYTISIHMI